MYLMNAARGSGFGPIRGPLVGAPCPSSPWQLAHPSITNSFLPFCAAPAGATGEVWPASARAPMMSNAVNISSAWLHDHIDQRGLAALHSRDRTSESGSEIGRTRNRSFGVHAETVGELREVDCGIRNRRPDVRTVDPTLPPVRHALQVH